jgi:hypothetical protein
MWGYLYFLVRAYCDGDDGSDLPRLRSVDWIGKSEATISSQLIMPVLHMLGYGEHALHPVPEQQIYKLRDPTVSKGSRRVQFDYEPTIYSEGLWVMEARVPTRRLTSKRSDQSAITRSIPEVPQSPNSVALRSRPRGKGSGLRRV